MRPLAFGLVSLGTLLGMGFACGQSDSDGGGGAAAGSATAGSSPSGAGTSGTAAGLVDCDPTKIVCKRLAPVCDAGEVPRVEGSCYGECVKVDQCACRSAEQCPQPNEYTCWGQQHCGPFVQ